MKRRKREAERKKLKSKGTERIDRERLGGGGGGGFQKQEGRIVS